LTKIAYFFAKKRLFAPIFAKKCACNSLKIRQIVFFL
jgi:hypothetical protein